jgi:hypothetical protein
MNYFVKPGVAQELYTVHEEEFSIKCYMCDTYIEQKAKPTHKRQTQPLVREDVTYGL